MVHDRWQRAAAGAGALAGVVLASWLLLRGPAAGPGAADRAPTTAARPADDWCTATEAGFVSAVDDLVVGPGAPDADAVAARTASWSRLLAGEAHATAWRSARSVPSPRERAEVVRQLQVLRDAVVEAASTGSMGAARAEAQALDELLGQWC